MTDTTADQMAPDASPGQISKKGGVRRVNNIPVYILGALMGSFLLIMMLVAADRAAQQNEPADTDRKQGGSTSVFAKDIAGSHTDGFIPAVAPPVVAEDAPPKLIIARPDNLDLPPVPPPTLNQPRSLQAPVRDEEAERIRMAKLQMLQEAARSKTNVQMTAPRSAPAVSSVPNNTPRTRQEMIERLAAVRQQINGATRDDPTTAYQARLAQVKSTLDDQTGGAGGTGTTGAPALLQTAALSDGNSASTEDRWRLDSRTEAPRSPYELRAGFVLPATLISGINSELPGQIVAQVSQHVYDTPTGRHLLIPQGSRLVGTYSSDVAYGQSRVLVAWQRVIFPDGKALDIGSMPGADGAGYAGFNDKTNNHYLRIFGSALLMSGVTAGIALSQDDSDSSGDSQRSSDALSEALGQQLGQVTGQMVAKNLSIAPTLEIRPGFRFNVIVTKDLTFSKPYQSFDY
jgi:type IV secretory pathway VirB10-like protein